MFISIRMSKEVDSVEFTIQIVRFSTDGFLRLFLFFYLDLFNDVSLNSMDFYYFFNVKKRT